MLTGEYTVLDGAKALALPTKYGQSLQVEPTESDTLQWKSLNADGSIWYEDTIAISEIKKNIYKGTNSVTEQLVKIVHIAHKANPEILNTGYNAVTELTFPRNWGLGTSSTLINNIAQWFGIDAHQLLWDSFGGSGYDIACAQNDSAILYRIENGLPVVTPINFEPDFTDMIYFVYLNQKQNSRSAIAAYKTKVNENKALIDTINTITESVLKTDSMKEFCMLVEKHEKLMAYVLNTPTVKQYLFPDFNGTLKSLGAWGGDFILAVAEDNPTAYFKDKGYTTIINYKDMIL